MIRSSRPALPAALGLCLLAFPAKGPAQTPPANGQACLEVYSTSVDFGNVWIGNEGKGYLQVRNTCPRAITINQISITDPAFRAATPLPVNLPAWNAAWLEFGFRPQATGPASGSARLTSNAGFKPASAALSGVGIVPPTMTVSPTSLNLAQAAGTQGSTSLQIANSGGDHLEAIVSFDGPALPRPASGWKVAFVQTPTAAGYGRFIDMVRSFSNVDTLDVFDGTSAVPSLAYLKGFDIVMAEAGGPWANASATGDTLGAYLQSGGKVLYFAHALAYTPNQLYGTILNFAPIQEYSLGSAGQSASLADHPINAGVSSFWAAEAMQVGYYYSPGSTLFLGSYAGNGYQTGAYHPRYPVVALNFHPADGAWSGDVPRLVSNALDYLGTRPAWMTTSGLYPGSDILTVSAGATRTLNLNVWTYRLVPGTYQGEIQLLHDDPAQASPYIVPVTLTVTP